MYRKSGLTEITQKCYRKLAGKYRFGFLAPPPNSPHQRNPISSHCCSFLHFQELIIFCLTLNVRTTKGSLLDYLKSQPPRCSRD